MGPISSSYSAAGDAIPVTTAKIEIAGEKWKLYKGVNAPQTVYSFVAEEQVTGFKGDLMGVFEYLEEMGVGLKSQFVASIGAGTEHFTYVIFFEVSLFTDGVVVVRDGLFLLTRCVWAVDLMLS